MLPTTTILARRIQQSLNSIALVAALSIGGIAAFTSPSSALSPMGSAALASQGDAATGDVVEIRVVARRGGAIAAGAAIGVVTAATAAAWAGAAPAPGMCWYYTDPSRTQGFWDYCQ